ncbi:MAG: hypothetical protein OXP71_11895 [Candidatus Poribacteria bacterium]|nr:hypothetical protein [Candidatus Poribacteria bacterium]
MSIKRFYTINSLILGLLTFSLLGISIFLAVAGISTDDVTDNKAFALFTLLLVVGIVLWRVLIEMGDTNRDSLDELKQIRNTLEDIDDKIRRMVVED